MLRNVAEETHAAPHAALPRLTTMDNADHAGELLAALEHTGAGLAVLELARDVALTAPSVSGVATLLPLSGAMYVLRDGAPPLRVKAGELALVPSAARIALAAARRVTRTVDSHARLIQRGGWIVVPAQPGKPPAAVVAAARIQGSRTAALDDFAIVPVRSSAIAGPLFAQLGDEVARGAAGHAGLGMALMNACVVHALRDAEAASPGGMPRGTTRGGGVARALAAIRAHPHADHSVDTLAELAGMSRSSFVRGFNRATGSAPQRFLQQARLEEASALLQSTALPVKTIAAMTGFRSRSHFSRSFRDAFAADPSTYREESRREPVPARRNGVPE